MTKYSDHRIENWKQFLFPHDHENFLGNEETAVLRFVKDWRRRFLVFMLVLCTVICFVLALDNYINQNHPLYGLFLVGMAAVMALQAFRVLRKKGSLFSAQLTVSFLAMAGTTSGAAANGILPLIFFAGVVVCYYMLLPVRYALGFSVATFIANTVALSVSPELFNQAIYSRVGLQALIVLPALHFNACLTIWLLSFYASMLSSRTHFISTVSHELRSPLNGMTGLIHLTREMLNSSDPAERQKVDQNLQRVSELQEHLSEIIGNTLDLNQLKGGKLKIHLEPIELKPFMESATHTFQAACEEKGIALVCDVVQGKAGELIEMDSLRLRQILFNLIGNAVKYTEQGKIRVEACLRKEYQADEILRLDVFDTGIGIPVHLQHMVFEEYSQLSALVKYRANGTGLGLSLVRELVSALGGTCGFNSTEGVGSHFWVMLPTRSLEQKEISPTSNDTVNAVSPQFSDLQGLRVLVADDEPINRQIISKVLSKRGVETVLAANGKEAFDLAKASASAFDMLIMDLEMPVLDGGQALAKIRELPGFERIPAICITGAVFESETSDPLDHGFDEYLSKPVKPDTLLSKVCYQSLIHKMTSH